MGIKVMIRLRGLTDWMQYGYVLTPKRAEILVKELRNRVQIITLPSGETTKDYEKKLDSKMKELYHDLYGEQEDGEYYIVYDTGFSGEE